MIKVDSCSVVENITEVAFRWRNMLNKTNVSILYSNCHLGCVNDPTYQQMVSQNVSWQPYCTELANMWRISKDINGTWQSMLHNLNCVKGLGKYASPGAWNDLDFLEVGNGDFTSSDIQSLLRAQAHFSLWCIVSSPLIAGNDLLNMTTAITNVLTNKYAIEINQNYLNNGGDIITAFSNVSTRLLKEVEENPLIELWYKPLPSLVGNAAVLFLNTDDQTTFNFSLEFSDLPLTNNHNNPLFCDVFDIWKLKTQNQISFYNATILPQSIVFLKLFNCMSNV